MALPTRSRASISTREQAILAGHPEIIEQVVIALADNLEHTVSKGHAEQSRSDHRFTIARTARTLTSRTAKIPEDFSERKAADRRMGRAVGDVVSRLGFTENLMLKMVPSNWSCHSHLLTPLRSHFEKRQTEKPLPTG
jgi:hypothetical protein